MSDQKPFRPMLASDVKLDQIHYPIWASPKLDGIRCIVRDGVCWSRSNKPIPNLHVQATFSHLEGYDGELIVGDPCDKAVYRKTSSGVMSREGEPDVTFFVFDNVLDMNDPWELRSELLMDFHKVAPLEHVEIGSESELLAYEGLCLELGYEGLILRRGGAPYKQGRSTVKEGYLLKLKRFKDAEFKVVGFEERMENLNVSTTNELGYTSRSSHQENKVGRGDLGALVLELADGSTFNCGTGFTDEDRADIWGRRESLLGALAKVKYFDIGGYVAPRHPVFLGWRSKEDM